jgi:small subunit ribosomal protein S16
MVKIRLRRVGAKKQPSYRIVVADARSPRDGRFIESIGFYNPRTEPATMRIDEERALHWLSVGAQPSDAVHRILDSLGTSQRLERLRAGEDMDALVAEAQAAAEARVMPDPRTRHAAPTRASKKKAKAEVASTAEVVEEEVEEAPTAEVAEEEVEETPVAEVAEEEVEETPVAEAAEEEPADEVSEPVSEPDEEPEAEQPETDTEETDN